MLQLVIIAICLAIGVAASAMHKYNPELSEEVEEITETVIKQKYGIDIDFSGNDNDLPDESFNHKPD